MRLCFIRSYEIKRINVFQFIPHNYHSHSTHPLCVFCVLLPAPRWTIFSRFSPNWTRWTTGHRNGHTEKKRVDPFPAALLRVFLLLLEGAGLTGRCPNRQSNLFAPHRNCERVLTLFLHPLHCAVCNVCIFSGVFVSGFRSASS